jgi:hypothetical protein
MKKIFYLIIFTFFSANSYASDFNLYPKVSTVAPVFAGGGFAVTYLDDFQLNLQFGTNPKNYYNQIAKIAASYGDNSKYESVINAAFQDNTSFRADLQYNFSGTTGWRFGVSGSRLKASGNAGIDEVLGAATGNDYTTLKNLLKALGRSTDVTLDSYLYLAEIYGGYTWLLSPSWFLDLTFGATKVVSSTLNISTGLPNFEASASGKSLLDSSEQTLEDIVNSNGISPILGLGINYHF